MDRCPFLHESLVQYCAAAPVSKYVPYSEGESARCSDDRHCYCDVLLALEGGRSARYNGEGIPWVPDNRYFSPNHLWLDIAPDGHWHIGADAFIAHVVGKVDRISYLTGAASHRPSAILTVGETDLQLVFPLPMQVTATNNHLRAQCDRITEEPYTGGWLFEGNVRPGSLGLQTLHSSEVIRPWMVDEMRRLDRSVQSLFAERTGLLNDGGTVVPGVMRQLDRQSALAIYSEFLSPFASWKESV